MEEKIIGSVYGYRVIEDETITELRLPKEVIKVLKKIDTFNKADKYGNIEDVPPEPDCEQCISCVSISDECKGNKQMAKAFKCSKFVNGCFIATRKETIDEKHFREQAEFIREFKRLMSQGVSRDDAIGRARDAVDKSAEYNCLLESGLSEYEARATVWPEASTVEVNIIRSKICDIISEMLDNPDGYGIYPTTKCYDKLEGWVRGMLENKGKV